MIDGTALKRMSLTGTKSVSVQVGNAQSMTLDYENAYVYYISTSRSGLFVYRFNYDTMDTKTVPQKLFRVHSSTVSSHFAIVNRISLLCTLLLVTFDLADGNSNSCIYGCHW